MALGVETLLDVVVIGLAVGSLFIAMRLRSLFAHGVAGRPLMLLALSPLLIGAGEAIHITSEVLGNATLELFHSVLETAFFVTVSVAALLFVRAWSQGGTITLGRPLITATEPEVLAAILNRLARHLQNITGPAFARAFFQQSVEEGLAQSGDPSLREKLLSRLNPDIRPPARRILLLGTAPLETGERG